MEKEIRIKGKLVWVKRPCAPIEFDDCSYCALVNDNSDLGDIICLHCEDDGWYGLEGVEEETNGGSIN